jgi:hypothetical protein
MKMTSAHPPDNRQENDTTKSETHSPSTESQNGLGNVRLTPDGQIELANAHHRGFEAATLKEAWRLLRISRAIADTWFVNPSTERIDAAERIGHLAATTIRALAQLAGSVAFRATDGTALGQSPASKREAGETAPQVSTARFEGMPVTPQDVGNVESALIRGIGGQFLSEAGARHDSDPHDSDPHDSDPSDFDRGNFDRANFDRA